VVLGVVAALLVLAVAAVSALVYYDRQIERIAVPTLGQGPDVDGGDTNYLLVGSDSRDDLTPEELAEVRTGVKTGGAAGTLTDTIVLVHVPGDGSAPAFVSLPRDAFVEIRGSGRGRINSAFAVGEAEQTGGGPAKLVETVQQLSGLQIDHYIEVGFIAFLRITDALDGIEVNLCAPVRDVQAAIDLPAGPQTLQGADALGFVRQRQGLPRGDLDRIVRQQYVLRAVARETLSLGTLLRPDRVLDVLDAVTSSIRADEDLSTFDLARLALRLRGGNLQFTTVPVADPNASRGGASVVLLDEDALPGFFAGLSPQTDSDVPDDLTVTPSAIRLEVRNGTDRAGLAAETADALRGVGFTVTGTANADRSDVEASVVLHGSGRADSARTVAAAVPGAEVRQDDGVGENGLVLVVGSDFSGVRGVTVAPRPAEPAPAAPPPAPPAPDAPPGSAPPPETDPCIT
jgi:LCP family protein required for cell wall assembly